MLCGLLLTLFISGAVSQSDADRFNYTCTIPDSSVIRHGRFRVEGFDDDAQPLPGSRHYSFVLQVFCNSGYVMKGWHLVQCFSGKGTDDFPECLPMCRRESPDILSCGVSSVNTEARCISPQGESISTRKGSQLQCGVVPQVFRTAVVNGREANREEVPWHCGVYTKKSSPYMQICGATIVSDNVVISAAHCFWSETSKQLPAEDYAVAVGKLYRPWNDPNDPDAQKSDVQEIRIPSRYQGTVTNFQEDIALLILSQRLKLSEYITPACLDFNIDFDESQIAPEKKGRVSGWGLASEDGPPSQLLNVVELPLVPIEKCIADADVSFLQYITSDKICAGYNNGTAVCMGDSGGGLLVPEVVDGTTRYYLRGIVSTAPGSDHLCNIYAAATFTHVARHERFIRNVIIQTPLSTQLQNSETTIIPPSNENATISQSKPTDLPLIKPSDAALNIIHFNKIKGDIKKYLQHLQPKIKDETLTPITNNPLNDTGIIKDDLKPINEQVLTQPSVIDNIGNLQKETPSALPLDQGVTKPITDVPIISNPTESSIDLVNSNNQGFTDQNGQSNITFTPIAPGIIYVNIKPMEVKQNTQTQNSNIDFATNRPTTFDSPSNFETNEETSKINSPMETTNTPFHQNIDFSIDSKTPGSDNFNGGQNVGFSNIDHVKTPGSADWNKGQNVGSSNHNDFKIPESNFNGGQNLGLSNHNHGQVNTHQATHVPSNVGYTTTKAVLTHYWTTKEPDYGYYPGYHHHWDHQPSQGNHHHGWQNHHHGYASQDCNHHNLGYSHGSKPYGSWWGRFRK